MYLEAYFQQDGPGAALFLGKPGAETHEECLGLADVAAQTEIDRHTRFDLASVSKMFTAAATLRLCEQGKLRLTDPLMSLLPLRVHTPGRDILVRDLLWHTSGIPDYVLENDPHAPGFHRESVIHWLENVRVDTAAGSLHQYSNTNYFLLAEIVAHLSGMPFDGFLQQHIFDKFGLNDTYLLGCQGRAPGTCRGYADDGLGFRKIVSTELDLPIYGDGAVCSSMHDLVCWCQLFFAGKVLRPDTLELATSEGRLDSGKPVGYGCGLVVESSETGDTWCGHTGGWYGTAAFLGFRKRDGLLTVLLSNDQTAPVVRIAKRSGDRWNPDMP